MKHASFNPAAFLRDENLRTLHGRKKVQYIWDYYKLPLAVLCIVLYAAGYMLYGRITHKDTVLYTALVNVASCFQPLSHTFFKSPNAVSAPVQNSIKYRIKIFLHPCFQQFLPPNRHHFGVIAEHAAAICPKH